MVPPSKTEAALPDAPDSDIKTPRTKVHFYGHFGSRNFGNEITLQTILFHQRRLLPDSEPVCICSYPDALAASEGIATIAIDRAIVREWKITNPVSKLARKVLIGVPCEIYRWLDAFRALKGSKMFIVPGTGLLTDAFGLRQWGPYNLFKWTLLARLRGAKVFFVSVGAGPIYSRLGRRLVRSALALAAFRSYRDKASMRLLERSGFRTNSDRLYPDLAFSLPDAMLPTHVQPGRKRPLIGIGLMEYAGRYSAAKPSRAVYEAYLAELANFAQWLLDHDYDVRILIGDGYDQPAASDFKSLLKSRVGQLDEERILDALPASPQELLAQLAATDVVVATRFHNVLFALLLNKPVIAISFHHKCASLMSEMGLSRYCQEFQQINADALVAQFQELTHNAVNLQRIIREKVGELRAALDEQYRIIFGGNRTCAGTKDSPRLP